ncbi:hypothetical protein QBC37DRAFT_187193 [Rhypophila decipiens]|uniref:Uncharacterized protein n=1 Tax=Rhypophila decipiens TaxID=261697 RepID=A0AAN6Y4V3_9PEZI|nr:hypothetical protein QBC37DRAFT_187193 [Rhypophila decipiens]
MFPTLSLLLLTSSPLLVHAQSAVEEMDEGPQIYNASWFGTDQVNYGGGREGPFRVPLSRWNDSLDDPDATMSVAIPMADLTKPFREDDLAISRLNALPQRHTSNLGWKWSINLTNNIDITPPPELEGQREEREVTGVRIRLHAPEKVTESMDDSWQVCIMQWMLKEGTNTSTFFRMHNHDECFLPPQCVRDLQNYAASGPAGFGRCQCPDPKAIPSCKDAAFPEWATCYTKPYKAPDVRKWENGILDVMSYAGRPHDENDNGFGFNATALISWPVMVVWALEGDAPPDNSSSSTLRSLTSATATRTGVITSTGTVATTTLGSSTGDASTPSGTGNAVKRQDLDGTGPRYAAAKLSCLSANKAVEGKPEAGIPVIEKNSAVGKFASMPSFSLLAMSGLAAAFALI